MWSPASRISVADPVVHPAGGSSAPDHRGAGVPGLDNPTPRVLAAVHREERAATPVVRGRTLATRFRSEPSAGA